MGLDQDPIREVDPDLVLIREVDSDHSLLMEQGVAEPMAEAAAMDTAMDMVVAEAAKQEEEEEKLGQVEVPLPPSVEVCFLRLLSAVGESMHRIP